MKRILAPFLAALILVSSTGLTYSTHFCMGSAVEHALKIGKHNLSCGMSTMDEDCSSDEMTLNAPGCCDNEHVFVEIEDDFKISVTETPVNLKFVVAFSYAFLSKNLTIEEPSQAFVDHSPPPLDHDYQTMLQTFIL